MVNDLINNEIDTLVLPSGAKIRVYWNDTPDNYSKESRDRIKKYFSKKYNISTQNINVTYKPIKRGNNGEIIEIDGATITNIMSTQYQHELFKRWIEREGREVDFNRIIALDSKVNSELTIKIDETLNRQYKINWISLDNFLSYGKNNHLNIKNYHGLTIVNSIPENQGGKSTLTIDAIEFLFFGETTKTDKNEQVFNQFSMDNELSVRGSITIENEGEIIIERKMARKSKRSGGWNIENTLNYFKLMPDGEEIPLNDESVTKTTKLIEDTIGTKADFNLVTLVTSRNLDDLVDSTAGESGKLLTRLIGLEVISDKETIVRRIYNDFVKTMKTNLYSKETLNEEIINHKLNINELESQLKAINVKLNDENLMLTTLNDERTQLITSKDKIDSEILTLNPSKLEGEMESIIKTAENYTKQIESLKSVIRKLGDIKFDEVRDFDLTTNKNKVITEIAVNDSKVKSLKENITSLELGQICKSCNRPLDNVDNTKHIEEHKKTLNNYLKINSENEKTLEIINRELIVLIEIKNKVKEKNDSEIKSDKLEVELELLRNQYKFKNSELKKYKQNLNAIDNNKKIDSQISLVETKIRVSEHNRDTLMQQINTFNNDVKVNNEAIIKKEILIKTIDSEIEIEKIFKLYIDMVGKKGISKLVLRSVLPVINSEIQRLLEDVTDFDVELFIDDKNEVRFSLIKDGVEKPLKSGSGFELTTSGIALRCVLGKLSNLPKPNIIVFDEVLGRVATQNLPNMKPLFDRISEMFDSVFFITQIDIAKDWANHIITVKKENNISKLI
jgi:hypothetical protein